MSNLKNTIIATKVDESPAYAQASLQPIYTAFFNLAASGITVIEKDISLATRILAAFPENLSDGQIKNDDLAELGNIVHDEHAVIIKLPNISATVSQLQEAIKELQDKGYNIPNYPDTPQSPAEQDIKSRYDNITGSKANPVLRVGNSLRYIPAVVKHAAQNDPKNKNEAWDKESKTHIAHMTEGDFKATEKSETITQENQGQARIEFIDETGNITVLKDGLQLEDGQIVDTAIMDRAKLRAFISTEMENAKNEGLLYSLHLKGTMMVKTDGVFFGDAVSLYFQDVFDKRQDLFNKIGIDPKNGENGISAKLPLLPTDLSETLDSKSAKNLLTEHRALLEHLGFDPATLITQLPNTDSAALGEGLKGSIAQIVTAMNILHNEVATDIQSCKDHQADLAVQYTKEGPVTNLNAANHVIVDASIPKMIRKGGKMWDNEDNLRDTKAVIPDSTYARMYQTVIDFCKEHGAFDTTKMGSTSNLGLMANKAEEYGSKDKTFESPEKGTIRLVQENGEVIQQHAVNKGDIWRMCQTDDGAIQDWVKRVVEFSKETGDPVVFWLDKDRAHDKVLIEKVTQYLGEHDTTGLDIQIMSLETAMAHTLQRAKDGKNTISATGNVMRDYLTDLFPILETGSSARMQSIVKLIAGGLLAETGSGGTAPDLLEMLTNHGKLIWDSLGESLAVIKALNKLNETCGNTKAKILGETLERATGKVLKNKKSPSKDGLDTRQSHYYYALYWAQELAAQTEDTTLQETFTKIAAELENKEEQIMAELTAGHNKPVTLDGNYAASEESMNKIMRPSQTLNNILG